MDACSWEKHLRNLTVIEGSYRFHRIMSQAKKLKEFSCHDMPRFFEHSACTQFIRDDGVWALKTLRNLEILRLFENEEPVFTEKSALLGATFTKIKKSCVKYMRIEGGLKGRDKLISFLERLKILKSYKAAPRGDREPFASFAFKKGVCESVWGKN